MQIRIPTINPGNGIQHESKKLETKSTVSKSADAEMKEKNYAKEIKDLHIFLKQVAKVLWNQESIGARIKIENSQNFPKLYLFKPDHISPEKNTYETYRRLCDINRGVMVAAIYLFCGKNLRSQYFHTEHPQATPFVLSRSIDTDPINQLEWGIADQCVRHLCASADIVSGAALRLIITMQSTQRDLHVIESFIHHGAPLVLGEGQHSTFSHALMNKLPLSHLRLLIEADRGLPLEEELMAYLDKIGYSERTIESIIDRFEQMDKLIQQSKLYKTETYVLQRGYFKGTVKSYPKDTIALLECFQKAVWSFYANLSPEKTSSQERLNICTQLLSLFIFNEDHLTNGATDKYVFQLTREKEQLEKECKSQQTLLSKPIAG